MLWAHALGAARPLRPRLINHDSVDDDDRKYFGGTLAAHGRRLTLKVHFKMSKSSKDIFFYEQKLVFGDYTNMGVPRDDRKNERDGA